jgi:predicted Zn-dependent protease
MQEQIIQTLQGLRGFALRKGYEVSLLYHEEDSHLMRFANSAISLNTNEHLVRLKVTAYSGRKHLSYTLITDPDNIEEMENAIEAAAGMVEHAQPLSYQPTIPSFSESFADESGWDASLAGLGGADELDYFNRAAAGLETPEIRLAGIFSRGTNTFAQITTRSSHTQYFKTSDAQVTLVLSHNKLKWEVLAEQSAQQKADLDPDPLHAELACLVDLYGKCSPQQIPLGRYDIVFGPAATAEMLNNMKGISFDGGSLKRGISFLSEDQVGKKVFSEQVSLSDDAGRIETFPIKRDLYGLNRLAWPIVEKGVFRGFTWTRDDADEFAASPTGHDVPHLSLVLGGGDRQVATLADLLDMPRERDLLYIPFLHYMNVVNQTKGIVTASSRFGALLLKKDGSVVVPYNVRLTQSLLDVFGRRVAWLSHSTLPYNTSESYGARNPSAIIVPRFLCVEDLEISHSNTAY